MIRRGHCPGAVNRRKNAEDNDCGRALGIGAKGRVKTEQSG